MTPQDVRSFSWYTGNLTWLPERTIFLCKAGSQAYGTSTPESDLDLRGIAVAPRAYYLGVLNSFEQAEAKGDVDATVYDIRKFVKLAMDANPNILELLWTDPSDWYRPGDRDLEIDVGGLKKPFGKLWWNRDLFLNKKAKHTFSGYAVAQLKRIKTHRRHLLDPPTHQPTRTEFGLPEGNGTLDKEQLGIINARIRKLEDSLAGKGFDKADVETERLQQQLVTNTVQDLNLATSIIPIIIAERRYTGACRAWQQYQTWKTERNEKRSALEAKFGYDTKHAMHLVRLLRMAHEILDGKGLIVKRPDAEELLAIRNGAWTYELLEAYAEAMDAGLGAIAGGSKLPEAPDRARIDEILVDIIENMP